jgi:hypothetical protein
LKKFTYNKVLIGLIFIGLLAALTVAWQRHWVEHANKQVELVMDLHDVAQLAHTEGVPLDSMLAKVKKAGVTSLAVYETTLEKLGNSGKITVLSGAQLLSRYDSGSMSDPFWRGLVKTGKINAGDIYVIGHDAKVFSEVKEDLVRRLSPERVTVLDSGRQILSAKADYEKAIKWNLGLSSAEMRYVSSHGFYVVVRPSNYQKVRAEDVRAVFDRMKNIHNISDIMFSGKEALGYPNQLPLTLALAQQQGLTFAMIESPLQLGFYKQNGLVPLAVADHYKAARVYVISRADQARLKMSDSVLRWIIADEERNIRIDLLRMYDKAEPGKTLTETNLKYISEVKQSLLAHGFTIGRATVYQPYFPPKPLLMLMILGATAAGVLFLTLLKPFAPRWQYLLVAIISCILIVPLLKGPGTLARQLAAMASANLFPVLAMTWQLDRWRAKEPYKGGRLTRILCDGAGSLIITVMLSFIGGIYVGALLGDVRFLLEMEFFRGVKVTFVLPLLLITAVYLSRFSLFGEETDVRGIWPQVRKILDYPVYIKSLLVFAVAGFVGWVFVGRSGNTSGAPVPAIELKMRAFLERAMYARPREKEFMIGHPAFFLAIMALYRRWPRMLHYVLVIFATIGQDSLVETFAHIRTPIWMSFVRGIDGLVVGILCGILAVIGMQVLHYLSLLLGRRPADNE